MLCFLGFLNGSNGNGNVVIQLKKLAKRVKMNGEQKEGGTLRFQFTCTVVLRVFFGILIVSLCINYSVYNLF